MSRSATRLRIAVSAGEKDGQRLTASVVLEGSDQRVEGGMEIGTHDGHWIHRLVLELIAVGSLLRGAHELREILVG